MLKPISAKTKRRSRRRVKLEVETRLPAWVSEHAADALQELAEDGRIEYSASFSPAERTALRYQKPIKISEWAEKYRFVHMSSVAGMWENETTPYLVGVMDAVAHNSVREVTLLKAPQTGGTEAVYNCLAYFSDRSPAPALVVFPDEGTAGENATDRIVPMFEKSNHLSKLFKSSSSERINLTTMPIYMGWSGSAAKLSNKPCKYLIADEVDKFQQPKKESSALDLQRKRARTYPKSYKFIKISSPSDSASPIDGEFRAAQAKFDYVARCPHCGHEQVMKFEHIVWSGGTKVDPEQLMSDLSAGYTCVQCGAVWDDEDRNKAVKLGHWRERSTLLELSQHLKLHNPISIGFHIPSWLSRFVSLSKVAADFVKYKQAERDNKSGWRLLAQDFFNGHLAERFDNWRTDRTEEELKRFCDGRPRGLVPSPDEDGTPRVSALIAGVDTQKGYFRYVVRAFGYGAALESWLVDYGSVGTEEQLVSEVLERTYYDGEGNAYNVELQVQDAMGHRTTEVYLFASRYKTKVLPIQGVDKLKEPVQYSPIEYLPGTQRRAPHGLKLGRVHTRAFKDQLAEKLETAPDTVGCFHLCRSEDMSRSYFEEMSVEYFDEDVGRWICPKNKANHYWDCEVYTFAGAFIRRISSRVFAPAEAQERKVIKKKMSGGLSALNATRPKWM